MIELDTRGWVKRCDFCSASFVLPHDATGEIHEEKATQMTFRLGWLDVARSEGEPYHKCKSCRDSFKEGNK